MKIINTYYTLEVGEETKVECGRIILSQNMLFQDMDAKYKRQIVRELVIRAYLKETNISEPTIGWFANYMPQINKTCKELNVDD